MFGKVKGKGRRDMRENDANVNPGWDAILGTDTMTGTRRLVGLVIVFVVLGGTVFSFL